MIRCMVSALAMMLLAVSACAAGPTAPGFDKAAPLFNDLGDHNHSITTASVDA